MHRTSTWLSDGRECVFYDRAPIVREIHSDERPLPPQPVGGQLRWDAGTGEWVMIAEHRQHRSLQSDASGCPLCPSRPGVPTEVPAADYDVVVFENRYPALTPTSYAGEAAAVRVDGAPSERRPPLRSVPAHGRCEIVCFSSQHEGSFAELDIDQARLIIDVWADRTAELGAMPGVEQVFCFENRGAEIGVTQSHPHGQIYALPFIAPRTKNTIEQITRYRDASGGDLFADLLDAERADGSRIVLVDQHWTAFVPYAARWPYEVHLYPNRRHAEFGSLDDAERTSLAPVYLDLLRRFDRLFDSPTPYIAAWHQAPRGSAGAGFPLHLELFTNRRTSERLKYLAGTESGIGVFSNDVAPEQAAKDLRDLAG
jgi:UDPglucose--hexose-1-phosphate uridylyltransferase